VSLSKSFLFFLCRCLLLVCFSTSFAIAQSPDKQAGSVGSASLSQEGQAPPPNVPGAPQPPPKPGELGWTFGNEHWWNHFALELSGGYVPVLQKGSGYFSDGYDVTAGVVDHLGEHLNLLFEGQFFGLAGSSQYVDIYGLTQTTSQSNTDFAFDLAASYDFLSRARNSPYIIGGAGYYRLGDVPPKSLAPCENPYDCPTNLANATAAPGFDGGIGFRHRLYSDRHTEIFAEGRYHLIAAGSSAYGQIAILPVAAGIRW
jgi:hypothetical protein